MIRRGEMSYASGRMSRRSTEVAVARIPKIVQKGTEQGRSKCPSFASPTCLVLPARQRQVPFSTTTTTPSHKRESALVSRSFP